MIKVYSFPVQLPVYFSLSLSWNIPKFPLQHLCHIIVEKSLLFVLASYMYQWGRIQKTAKNRSMLGDIKVSLSMHEYRSKMQMQNWLWGSKTQYKGNNTKKSECFCVDVDEHYSSGAYNNCKSDGSCICTYGQFAVRISNFLKNCKAFEKSQTPNTATFDACPYHTGQNVNGTRTITTFTFWPTYGSKCKRNPNTGEKQCFCDDNSKQIPPFNLRPNSYACCNDDSDCIEHTELYCYCPTMLTWKRFHVLPWKSCRNKNLTLTLFRSFAMLMAILQTFLVILLAT